MYKMINEGRKINVFYLFFLSLKLQEDLSPFDKKILDFNEAWMNVNFFLHVLLMFPLPLLKLLPKLSIDSFRALLEF